MKKFLTPLVVTLFMNPMLFLAKAQTLSIHPPDDIVLTADYNLDISKLTNKNYTDLGKIAFVSNSVNNIITQDRLCNDFCLDNDYIDYQGNSIINNPLSRVAYTACSLYHAKFEPSNPGKIHKLNWGFDGFATGGQSSQLSISILDKRKCTQGLIQRIFTLKDLTGASVSGTQNIWIIDCDFVNYTALACMDDVQLSLSSDPCEITLAADMFLEGFPYCYAYYNIEARYWTTVGAQGLIDRNTNKTGVQLGKEDLGKEFRITIRDPVTGNSCWGHASVVYKLPPNIKCPNDISINCLDEAIPVLTGSPAISASCINSSIQYSDDIVNSACITGIDKLVTRTWKVTNEFGLSTECKQKITFELAKINEVKSPKSFDGIELPQLVCIEEAIPNFDASSHISDITKCVGGYILDSVFWKANSSEPDIFPNRRIPRILGWNTIPNSNSPSGFTPSPDPEYYKSYFELSGIQNACWSSNTFIMWKGSGRPSSTSCSNLRTSFEDVFIDLSNPACNSSRSACFKVLRKWTILDWCTKEVKELHQTILISDFEKPEIIYPTVIELFTSSSATANWNVVAPVLSDNCSTQSEYAIESNVGIIKGDYINGFSVTDIPIGEHIFTFTTFDCCGNKTQKQVTVKVSLISKINEANAKSLELYPNPTKGNVKISFKGNYDQLFFSSLDGNLQIQQARNSDNEYDFSGVPAGVYFIQLYDLNKLLVTEKLVVGK